MFFLIGVRDQQKQLNFTQTMLCPACGRYGRYEVFLICRVFTFFFIPLIRWNKRYYVRTTCCNRRYLLNPEVGKKIEWGEKVEITPNDLAPDHSWDGYGQGTIKRCPCCGYTTTEDFEFCPKCGTRFS